jgi:hypothetical protein
MAGRGGIGHRETGNRAIMAKHFTDIDWSSTNSGLLVFAGVEHVLLAYPAAHRTESWVAAFTQYVERLAVTGVKRTAVTQPPVPLDTSKPLKNNTFDEAQNELKRVPCHINRVVDERKANWPDESIPHHQHE